MEAKKAAPGALFATGLAVAATALGAVPAQAAPTQVITFNKGDGPTTGVLYLKVDGTTVGKWRAGSGNGAQWNNDCAKERGHLPNGTYSTSFIENKDDLIKGRAVYLGDKRCSAGTETRTELFIHSEQTAGNTQGATEPRRWDGDEDYKSEGCVKMHPNDIAALFKLSAANPGRQDAILNVVS